MRRSLCCQVLAKIEMDVRLMKMDCILGTLLVVERMHKIQGNWLEDWNAYCEEAMVVVAVEVEAVAVVGLVVEAGKDTFHFQKLNLI